MVMTPRLKKVHHYNKNGHPTPVLVVNMVHTPTVYQTSTPQQGISMPFIVKGEKKAGNLTR
jgi:hypothetical protein